MAVSKSNAFPQLGFPLIQCESLDVIDNENTDGDLAFLQSKSEFLPVVLLGKRGSDSIGNNMKARLLFVALTVLAINISLLAQGSTKPYAFKFGSLESGDTLMISVFKQPYFVTGTERINVSIRAVVRDDFKLDLPPNVRLPLLSSITAGGLTTSELQRVLEERYAENNYDLRIYVRFLGNKQKSELDRIIERIGKPPAAR
jgi:protein involved in polysaccharide export with SLBB domain